MTPRKQTAVKAHEHKFTEWSMGLLLAACDREGCSTRYCYGCKKLEHRCELPRRRRGGRRG